MTVKQTLLMVIANLSDSECERFLEFLNTEKELVVLDAPAASDVRNLECVADSTDAIEQTSGAALETRIDSGNKICSRCKQPYTKEELFEKEHCYYCGNREDFEEES